MTRRRTMLITGAGSGIGRGIAFAAAADGWRVLATDLDQSAAEQTANDIRAAGGDGDGCALDVGDSSAVDDFAQSAQAKEVDTLINNAGLQHVARLEEFPDEQWMRLVEVMLGGSARMTRALLPIMRENNFGRILNIGSIHSLVASPYKSAYVAAKHGLLGLAKTIALETAEHDITINTICPSYVRTPLVEQQIAAQAREHKLSEEEVVREVMLKPMPKQAFITIDELYAAVAYLASDSARNITGQVLTIDGGWTAR